MEDTQDTKTAGEEAKIESASPTRVLGLLRWVQYIFVVFAAFLFWLFDKIITLIWQNFAEPDTTVTTLASLFAGGLIAYRLYMNERASRITTEIVGELSKVTWPSRKETQASTVVVIITSLIAAAIVGSFDAVWSAITDLLYKYKV